MTTPAFETLYDNYESKLLRDAHEAITKCDLWDWMRSYTPQEGLGFVFTSHPNLDAINKAMKMMDDHSGGSYGWTMRQMESIAKIGWDAHKNMVRKARADRNLRQWADEQRTTRAATYPTYGSVCPCRLAQGFKSGWCGVAGGGVPACDH